MKKLLRVFLTAVFVVSMPFVGLATSIPLDEINLDEATTFDVNDSLYLVETDITSGDGFLALLVSQEEYGAGNSAFDFSEIGMSGITLATATALGAANLFVEKIVTFEIFTTGLSNTISAMFDIGTAPTDNGTLSFVNSNTEYWFDTVNYGNNVTKFYNFTDNTGNSNVAPVPEPETILLFAVGLGILFFIRYRDNNKSRKGNPPMAAA